MHWGREIKIDRQLIATMLVAVAVCMWLGRCPLFGQPAPTTRPAGGIYEANWTAAIVCDAGGSMAPVFATLRAELSKAVESLQPHDKFSIIFMQAKQPASLDPELIPATPENKAGVEAFCKHIQPKGTTDPIPALDLAFQQKPLLIYILASHDFPDDAKVLEEIRKLDPDCKVKVNVIVFVEPGDKSMGFKKFMKQIADETGGTFKSINSAEQTTLPATLPATRP